MTFIGFLSLALLLAVATWAAMVLARAADWRIRGLAGLLGLVTLANILPFVSAMETWGFRSDGPGDVSDLFSGLAAFVAVVLLDRILRRNQLLERRLGSHLEYFERLFETVGEAMLLLDREGRIKPCGGAIPPRLIEDFDVPESQLVAKISTARMISPTQRHVDIPIENGFVGME